MYNRKCLEKKSWIIEQTSNPATLLISFFMPHSKKHEKTIIFLEEVKMHGLINSRYLQG